MAEKYENETCEGCLFASTDIDGPLGKGWCAKISEHVGWDGRCTWFKADQDCRLLAALERIADKLDAPPDPL